jgi:hypothetical protein
MIPKIGLGQYLIKKSLVQLTFEKKSMFVYLPKKVGVGFVAQY